MNFEELIRNWHKKKIVPEDYFSNFIFEYLAFIAYLKKIEHYEGDDRQTINQLKNSLRIAKIYEQLISGNHRLKVSIHQLIRELRDDPLKNVTRPEQLERHWSGNEIGVIRDTKDWENIVEFWYTVRNNLFHGMKDPECPRDMDMAEYAYKTINPLVGDFVKALEKK